MPSPQRLEFVTRHFVDLQTIRFAPVPAAMVLALAAHRMPHLGPSAGREMLLIFLLLVGGFYWWSTAAIRRRYGSVKISRKEAQRMQSHPIIRALYAILFVGLLWSRFFAHSHFSDLYISSTIFIGMLTIILDSTNLASRRIAWTIGLVVLFTAGPFLIGLEGGAAIFSLAGTVGLSLSVFDFLLLRRTFTEISASPSGGATGTLVHFG
jgi:hypothetical protein